MELFGKLKRLLWNKEDMTHSYRSTIGENDTCFYFPFSLVKLQLWIQCTLVATCSKYTLSLFLSILLASISFCSVLFYSILCSVMFSGDEMRNAMQCNATDLEIIELWYGILTSYATFYTFYHISIQISYRRPSVDSFYLCRTKNERFK